MLEFTSRAFSSLCSACQLRRGGPDQDIVKAGLKEGVNEFLMKVVNNAGGWAACLRITEPDGAPLKFQQRED